MSSDDTCTTPDCTGFLRMVESFERDSGGGGGGGGKINRRLIFAVPPRVAPSSLSSEFADKAASATMRPEGIPKGKPRLMPCVVSETLASSSSSSSHQETPTAAVAVNIVKSKEWQSLDVSAERKSRPQLRAEAAKAIKAETKKKKKKVRTVLSLSEFHRQSDDADRIHLPAHQQSSDEKRSSGGAASLFAYSPPTSALPDHVSPLASTPPSPLYPEIIGSGIEGVPPPSSPPPSSPPLLHYDLLEYLDYTQMSMSIWDAIKRSGSPWLHANPNPQTGPD